MLPPVLFVRILKRKCAADIRGVQLPPEVVNLRWNHGLCVLWRCLLSHKDPSHPGCVVVLLCSGESVVWYCHVAGYTWSTTIIRTWQPPARRAISRTQTKPDILDQQPLLRWWQCSIAHFRLRIRHLGECMHGFPCHDMIHFHMPFWIVPPSS
jgi:hypothetical protein